MRIHTSIAMALALLLGAGTSGAASAAACKSNEQNKAGIFQAGSNSVTEGATVTLTPGNGNNTSPLPPISILTWARVSGPAVTLTPVGNNVTFTVPKVLTGHSGQLVISLTVDRTDCTGDVPAVDRIVLNITNLTNAAPTAVATTPTPSVSPGTLVSLVGTGSYDLDNDPINYAWTYLLAAGDPAVSLVGANTPTATFVAPAVSSTATLTFRLTVTEALAPFLSSSADVTVNVVAANQPPTAVLTCPEEAGEGASITLDASGSTDPDSPTLAYAFTQDSGFPLADLPVPPHGSSISFPAPALGYQQGGNIGFRVSVSDGQNSSLSAPCTVFIMDVTDPVIAGATDIVVAAEDASGAHASFDVTWTDNVDGGPNPAMCSPVSGSLFPLGVTTVNCSATDSSDNASNDSFTVTVTDQAAPVIASRGDETVEATSAAGAISNYATPGTTDNVDPPGSATCVPPPGSQFALGSTTVNCSASDAAGNAAIPTSFDVVVQDTIAPSITPPADQSFEATAALTPLDSSDYGSATATDAVGIAEESNDAPALFPLGPTTITWYARDASGNSSTAFTVITLVDSTAPAFDPASYGDQTIEATSAAGAVALFEPTASDAVDAAPVVACDPLSGSTFPLGATVVACTATDDAGNIGNASFTITVEDTTAPIFDSGSYPDIVLEATSAAGAVATFAPTASDAVDASPTIDCTPASGSTFALGDTTVNCTATDDAGNIGNASFNVKVQDTTAPVFDAGSYPDIVLEATSAAGAVATFAPTASDAVDASPTIDCTPASGSTFALGDTTVNCTAADDAGNTGNASFNVKVQDTTAPILDLPANITAEATSAAGAAVSFSVTASDLVDATPTINCIPASGSTFALGTTTVNCSATDDAGNTANGSFTVKVQDTTAPVIAAHANVVATATSGSGAIVNYTLPTATDLVDGNVAVTCLPASGSQFPLGATTVNCSATDAAGNTDTSSFTVTVSFAFNGFFRPIDNLPVVNVVKAGQAIPVKFSLGGNMGLNIFAAGYPKSNVYTCSSGAPTDVIEETVTAGGSSLSYDPLTGHYNYVWKTDKSWAGQCRQLIVKFADGNQQVANFNFTR